MISPLCPALCSGRVPNNRPLAVSHSRAARAQRVLRCQTGSVRAERDAPNLGRVRPEFKDLIGNDLPDEYTAVNASPGRHLATGAKDNPVKKATGPGFPALLAGREVEESELAIGPVMPEDGHSFEVRA